MPYGWHPYVGADPDAYDIGLGETVNVSGGGGTGYNRPLDIFTVPGGEGAGGNWSSGGPGYSRGSYLPPSSQTPNGGIPVPPDQTGSITVDDPDSRAWWEKTMQWLKENFHFSAGGGGLGKLLELLAKGYTGYELYKAVTSDDPKDGTGTGSTGGGKGGGGGGGGKNSYHGAGGVGVYQGLNYQPSFLAWQPNNAGAPQFTSGGPSSLYGTPQPPPTPVAPKKKKKAGA